MKKFNLFYGNLTVLLMYICVYFMSSTQFVNFAYAYVSDEANYQNLPIIYNFEEECLPNVDQNLNTCASKAWLVVDGVAIYNHSDASGSVPDIDDCFKMCFNSPNCLAVKRNRAYRTDCWIYDQHYFIKENQREEKFKTFFLKCCALKKQKTSDLNEPNYPILFWTDYLLEHQGYTEKKRCKNYVWGLREKTSIDESFLYKSFKLKNTIDCLNECTKDKNCTAIKTYIDEFDQMCYLYKEISETNKNNEYRTNVYLLLCAKINDQVLRDGEFPKLYEPTKVCKTVSTTKVRECEGKIWHAEDGVRRKGHYDSGYSLWLGTCLNTCAEERECVGISFDRINLRCLYFKEGQFTNHYRQFHWTTYTLKCCNEFKNDKFNEENLLQSSADSIEFSSLPIISNITEDCLGEENQHEKQCATKAWLVVDNLRIKMNSHKTETNILTCFQNCLNSIDCKGVSIEKSTKEFCWTENDGQLVNETNNEYKSFFLTCCALKKKETIVENKNNKIPTSNFPIVFDLQSNCQYRNYYSTSCKYPTWHMQERTTLTISSIRNSTNTNTMDMLNECAKINSCKAISVEEVSPFVTVFRQYENIKNELQKSKTNAKTTIVYEKVCCKLPFEAEWKSNNPDLIMLNKPITNCKSISLADVDCPVKVWHMRDGVRLKGHFKIIPLESVQSCLRKCFQTLPCKGVSVDYYQRRCLLFGGSGFIEYVKQPQWVSFLMKCCYDVGMQVKL